MIKELLMDPIMVPSWILITHGITVVKMNGLLFANPCTYNQYQMFIIFLFICPCLWTCDFSSCFSINSSAFIDLYSAM